MIVEQIYTNCLAQAAYYIESNGEVAVIDPLRDIEVYIEKANKNGATIKYIFETHFHADFVSGHIDLANTTGAKIVFGPGAQPLYNALIAKDNETFNIGNIKIKALHTPGHTIESTSYLLIDEQGIEHCVFTGDTLFVGDVGRPDLLSGNLNKDELASMLYDSLNEKIKTLPAGVIVYPGHGPGSACGKNIGSQTFSTIGDQVLTNYALRAASREEFIQAVTADLPVPPAYFFKDAGINKNGYEPIGDVIERNLRALNIEEFKEEMQNGALVLDTRNAGEFATGFIKGAVNIGLSGDFATWVGSLIDFNTSLLLLTNKGQEKEAVTRLARVGYENVKGFLNGGIQTWIVNLEDMDYIPNLTGDEYYPLINSGEYALLDVRTKTEASGKRIAGSIHIPLNTLNNKISSLDKNEKWLVYCAGGYRSMIAASILKAQGFNSVSNIDGGINAAQLIMPEFIEN